MSRIMCILLAVVILLVGSCSDFRVSAGENKAAKPTFTIKKINNDTGVKLTINKTKDADGYRIYVTKRQNADSKYYNQNGIFDINDMYPLNVMGEYFTIEKNGKKKRTFTIKGLQKGTYSFVVEACKRDDGELYTSSKSVEKSVKIKSGKKVKREEVKYDFSSVKAGDVIEFGAYEQDDDMNNGKEPIEWMVLSVEDDKMLVVSKYVLDRIPFDKCTWEEYYDYNVKWCSILEWLNDNFYKSAFSKSEKTMIENTIVTREEYVEDGDDYKIIEKPIEYKAALLTAKQLNDERYGFGSENDAAKVKRRCAPTEYAKAQGINTSDEYLTEEGKESCSWWGIADNGLDEYTIHASGGARKTYFCDEGGELNNNGLGVRPAIYIKIK